jgi:hypothetical protein
MFDTLFWWIADAYNQKETRGCLAEFSIVFICVAVIAILVHVAWKLFH